MHTTPQIQNTRAEKLKVANLKSCNAQDQDSEKKPSIGLRFHLLVNQNRFFQKAQALMTFKTAFKTNDHPPQIRPAAQAPGPKKNCLFRLWITCTVELN
ncbi:hypothetical protein [Thiomonas sp.]|uniref:hypothetical protein n=1 Tax=Thiomonas sp. TaxID=2047785 RepID=UPI00258940DD|nr:hypothetical protein [Thiomonas sp.]